MLGKIYLALLTLLFAGCAHPKPNAPPLEAPPSQSQAPGGLAITIVNSNPNALQTQKLLEGFLKTYNLAPYLFTDKVQIQPFVIPHSHPVLTLNTRHNAEPDLLLSTFLHEELHWFLSGPYQPLTQKAIAALKVKFPKVPVGGTEGANDEDSTYLHLIVCWLELQADKRYLGDQRAYEVIRKTDHYTWIYQQVLSYENEIGALIRRSGLTFRSARTVRSLNFKNQFDRLAWLQDFEQLKTMIAETYPNLEAGLSRLNLRQMDQDTRTRLAGADSNLEAFLALADFTSQFKDGHFFIEPKKMITENLPTSDQSICPTLTKDHGFRFPTPPELGFGPTLDGAFPLTTLKVGEKTVGLVRIASFVESDYPTLCAEEWDKFRLTLKATCDDTCRDLFVYQILANRLLQTFAQALTTLQSEKIDALVLDLTDNGGGSDWVGGIIRMLSNKPILCGQFGFIRHPHWTKALQEQIADCKKSPLTCKKLKQLEHDLKESTVRCDRSNMWAQETYHPDCSLVVKRPIADCSPSDDLKFKSGAYNGRLFVLVNGNTASASEDLVGRYKDSKIGTIIGEKTLGAGCGFTNGGIPLVLANSQVRVHISDCARFFRDGSNEVLGIRPDAELPMNDLKTDAFSARLKDYLSHALP